MSRWKEDGKCERHGETACPSCLTYDNGDLKRQLAEAQATVERQGDALDWSAIEIKRLGGNQVPWPEHVRTALQCERDEARTVASGFQATLKGWPGVCDNPPSYTDLMNVLCDLRNERDEARAQVEYEQRRATQAESDLKAISDRNQEMRAQVARLEADVKLLHEEVDIAARARQAAYAQVAALREALGRIAESEPFSPVRTIARMALDAALADVPKELKP